MEPPNAAELLRVWEEGWTGDPVGRALLLLERAWPEEGRETLEALPLGRRDARLLELREQLFGPEVTGTVRCPDCGEEVELAFSLEDVQPDSANGGPPEPLTVREGGYEVEFRLPDSTDLAALLENGGVEVEDGVLVMERCFLAVRRKGRSIPGRSLPSGVVEAVARRMSEADPRADLQARLECPACRHEWRAPFDIASYLWTEIEAWARRTLTEVHLLARAYGWSEWEILCLGPARRRAYIELAHP